MRLARLLLAIGLAGVATVIAPGCRDATQMTVDVRAVDATCAELKGTSVTVGIEPGDTENRVKQGYVNATTTACSADGEIGTLVVTPSDAKRGAVVVVVAYGTTTDPSKCLPPDYKGCIVARRSFAFVDHEGLRLPITISPDCLDVPCDAFSTCRHGQCFGSEVQCNGGSCNEPGATIDGGTAPGNPPPPPPPGGPNEPVCDGATLHCHPSGDPLGDVACSGPAQACCSRNGLAVCGAPSTCATQVKYCCSDTDCGSGRCVRPTKVMGAPDAAILPDGSIDDSGVPDADAGFMPDGALFDGGSPSDASLPPPDAGTLDSGSGLDAGSNPGTDAGSNPGTDAGTTTPPGSGLGVCE